MANEIHNDTCRNNQEKDVSLFRNVRNYFREYCQCTSIHGFRYFGEKRTYFERGWWFIVFVTCMAACAISIYAVYQKWNKSPVIVSFATRGTPIYEIPFPAVTICPESKTTQNTFNFTKILQDKQDNKHVSRRNTEVFEYLTLLCGTFNDIDYLENKYVSPEDFFSVLDTVKPKFHLSNCHYMGTEENCNTFFTPIITDEGICYTYNMLDRTEIFRENIDHYAHFHTTNKTKNWTVEHGYTEHAGLEPYPKRALLSGANNAFSFDIMTRRQDTDYACNNGFSGYRVMLHTAMRLPRPSQQYFQVPLDQSVVGAIEPVMITTSDSVKMYDAQKRECYFPSERYLKYFKIYTSLNCQMECLTNITLQYCNCVNFFMPRENGTHICGKKNVRCMKKIERMMLIRGVKQKLEDINGDNSTENKRPKFLNFDCDCLPICTDLTYEIEVSQTDLEWIEQSKALRLNINSTQLHKSSLKLFFKTGNFIMSQRNELYGPTDFLANFGGLLGLFTGFSVLSLMEIIYFLTVRLCCNWRLFGHWAGKKN